jgi:hypothetical protein
MHPIAFSRRIASKSTMGDLVRRFLNLCRAQQAMVSTIMNMSFKVLIALRAMTKTMAEWSNLSPTWIGLASQSDILSALATLISARSNANFRTDLSVSPR